MVSGRGTRMTLTRDGDAVTFTAITVDMRAPEGRQRVKTEQATHRDELDEVWALVVAGRLQTWEPEKDPSGDRVMDFSGSRMKITWTEGDEEKVHEAEWHQPILNHEAFWKLFERLNLTGLRCATRPEGAPDRSYVQVGMRCCYVGTEGGVPHVTYYTVVEVLPRAIRYRMDLFHRVRGRLELARSQVETWYESDGSGDPGLEEYTSKGPAVTIDGLTFDTEVIEIGGELVSVSLQRGGREAFPGIHQFVNDDDTTKLIQIVPGKTTE